ncbi:MAG: amidohydrolase family protein [Mycobacteriales bacterium]
MTLIRGAQVDRRIVDVRFDRHTIRQVSPHGMAPIGGEEVIDANGAALLPGLHDHHIHLLATAAAQRSVDVSGGLDALLTAPREYEWIRAVGGDDDLDAETLDRVVADRPVRVQHRSGAMWALNSVALTAVDAAAADAPGIERDGAGNPTGRLWRMDDWLGERITDEAPDLASLGRQLSAFGITGVTDATPSFGPRAAALFAAAKLPQHVHFLADQPPAAGYLGPRKIVIEDHALPTYDALREEVADARVLGRAVAVHCVTREALVLILAVLDEVGTVPGDRIEHAALVDPEAVARLARLGVTVVTQPGFIRARGDRYLRDIPESDLPDLYRYATLQDAGVTVVPSSDAPYGPLDPWEVMRSARDRRAASRTPVNAREWVSASMVLTGYLRHPHSLHSPPRKVRAGGPADLVLLRLPLADALDDPRADMVHRTWHATWEHAPTGS